MRSNTNTGESSKVAGSFGSLIEFPSQSKECIMKVKFVIIESETIENSKHFGTGQLTDLYL